MIVRRLRPQGDRARWAHANRCEAWLRSWFGDIERHDVVGASQGFESRLAHSRISPGGHCFGGGGGDSGVGKLMDADDAQYGFNAETEEFADLVAAGVIDPTMVARTALQNASSIASLLLTTEALVTEIPEETPPAPAGHAPDMGGMGGMY